MTKASDDRPGSRARRAAPGDKTNPNSAIPKREPADAIPGEPAPEDEGFAGERIAKAIARAGIASRRDAEAMIEAGRVTLNGKVVDSPALNVTDEDRIAVDGEPLPARERTRLWLFHKPRGLVTTARDPEGRPTVFDELPEDLPRVVAIGRLDINTEGLLLLTNDGGLAKVIAHPDTGWLRRYRVRAHGVVNQAQLDALRGGVVVDGMEYGPVEARLDRALGDNVWITLGLREGKNREVKRILEHLGLRVNRLIRLSFGPFQLGELETGMVEEVRTRVLKDQLGDTLAQEAGVDFESPVREPVAPFGSPKAAPARSEQERPRRGAPSERPARSDRPDRAPRERGGREEAPAAPYRRPAWERGPRASIWRAGDEEGAPQARRPRAADPRADRAATAERPRERVGAIASKKGGRVLVERLKSGPAQELREKEPREKAPRARPDREAGDRRPAARTASARAPRREAGDKRDFGGKRDFGEKRDFAPRGAGPARDGERPRQRKPWAEGPGGEARAPREDRGGSRGEGRAPRKPGFAGGAPGRDGERNRDRNGERGAGRPPARGARPEGGRPGGERSFGERSFDKGGAGRDGAGRGAGGGRDRDRSGAGRDWSADKGGARGESRGRADDRGAGRMGDKPGFKPRDGFGGRPGSGGGGRSVGQGGGADGRPSGGSGGRPAGKPGGRPFGKSPGRPGGGKPGGRPGGGKPGGKPRGPGRG